LNPIIKSVETTKAISRIALLGNYPPRRCGIATFTADLANALLKLDQAPVVDVIAMNDRATYNYPPIVCREIPQQDIAAYRSAAQFINEGGYDVLALQHEYGIFGGDCGRFLLTLLRDVRVPIVTTLHTVLPSPSAGQRAVLSEILELSSRVIVMSACAVEILEKEYRTATDKVEVVHHGIPEFSPVAGGILRELLDIPGPMLLTFGLLSPGKGIEYVIHAMPAIVERCPGAQYVLLGATHPHILQNSGETYRSNLEELASTLGVSENVRFVNQYVTTKELTAYLGAADIYISPSLAREQITSGTLAYAVGAGKKVVATACPHAEELLADGRGRLVPFNDSSAIANAVIEIEDHPEESTEMARRASAYGLTMQWSEVAKATMATFALAANAIAPERISGSMHQLKSHVPRVETQHLLFMSDDTGIFQHATYNMPNLAEGYCVDDNARALLFSVYLEQDGPLSQEMARAQSRYLAFVCHAFNPSNGRFRNFMGYGREWLESAGSEDSHGRSMWSLAVTAARSKNSGFRTVALQAFESACPAVLSTTSPRTWAFAMVAAQELLRTEPRNASALVVRNSAAKMLFDQYRKFSKPEWPWFEDSLAYGNAKLSEALISVGHAIGNEAMLEAGIRSLWWLAKRQTAEGGVFAPIGTQSFFTDQKHPLISKSALFDQQPLEVWDSISAYLVAAECTGDAAWLAEADRAYGWFLGDNMVGVPMFDALTGGCRDGLHEDRANENQGAESTLAFLCASLEMRQFGSSARPKLFGQELFPTYEKAPNLWHRNTHLY
jgi:glycosyltransferase involved in cell wall biosynthesis